MRKKRISTIDAHGRYKRFFKSNPNAQIGIPAVHQFKVMYWDTMDDPPPLITSKQQLKEECRKRGLISRYLEDSV